MIIYGNRKFSSNSFYKNNKKIMILIENMLYKINNLI